MLLKRTVSYKTICDGSFKEVLNYAADKKDFIHYLALYLKNKLLILTGILYFCYIFKLMYFFYY